MGRRRSGLGESRAVHTNPGRDDERHVRAARDSRGGRRPLVDLPASPGSRGWSSRLLVFQWDFTTVYAISVLFGVVAIIAGVNEFFAISVSTTRLEVGARRPRRAVRRSSGSRRSGTRTRPSRRSPRSSASSCSSRASSTSRSRSSRRSEFELWWLQLDRRPDRDPARLLGRRELPQGGDPARRLRRHHRARPRDQRDLRRLQAQGSPARARGCLTLRVSAVRRRLGSP